MKERYLKWDRPYTLITKQISDGPLINVLPVGRRSSDVIAFEQNTGTALLVDGMSHEVKEKFKICDTPITAVENVKLRGFDHFFAADDQGNLFSCDYTLDRDPRLLLKRNGAIHSILDLGRSRVLIAYHSGHNQVTIEMITSNGGELIDSIVLDGTYRIRHMFCHKKQYGKGSIKVLAGTDRAVIEIKVNNFKMKQGFIWHIDRCCYIDEVYMNDQLQEKYVYKYISDDPEEEMHPNSRGVWSSDEDEKLSSVYFAHEVKTMTERGRVTVCANEGKYHKVVDIGDEVIHRHIHHPEFQVIGVTQTGKMIWINFRSSALSFIQDA